MLLAAVVVLVAAFMLAPAALLRPDFGAYDSETYLQDDLGHAFVEFWRSGTPALNGHFTTLVDYWFQWHAIKVAISAALVVVLALLSTALWRTYLYARTWYAAAATATTVLTVLAVGVLIVNVQATAVPLVALLPLLPEAPATANSHGFWVRCAKGCPPVPAH